MWARVRSTTIISWLNSQKAILHDYIENIQTKNLKSVRWRKKSRGRVLVETQEKHYYWHWSCCKIMTSLMLDIWFHCSRRMTFVLSCHANMGHCIWEWRERKTYPRDDGPYADHPRAEWRGRQQLQSLSSDNLCPSPFTDSQQIKSMQKQAVQHSCKIKESKTVEKKLLEKSKSRCIVLISCKTKWFSRQTYSNFGIGHFAM